MAKWKVLKSEQVHKAGFFRLRTDQCELPDGRVMPKYYITEFPDWVNIVALTQDLQVILVEQYRHAAGEVFLEVPGGMIHGQAEEHKVGGQRELREETGYESSEWIYCGYQYPNPATQNNRLHTYLALNCKRAGDQILDPFEDLQVCIKSLSEVLRLFEAGEFKHSLIVTSLQAAFLELKRRGYKLSTLF